MRSFDDHTERLAAELRRSPVQTTPTVTDCQYFYQDFAVVFSVHCHSVF